MKGNKENSAMLTEQNKAVIYLTIYRLEDSKIAEVWS